MEYFRGPVLFSNRKLFSEETVSGSSRFFFFSFYTGDGDRDRSAKTGWAGFVVSLRRKAQVAR